MSGYEVTVESFVVRQEASDQQWVYERDEDLSIGIRRAQDGRGSHAGVLLVELGIDGYPCHRARLDFGYLKDADEEAFNYDRSPDAELRALTDAIETLTILRDELARAEGREVA